MFRDQHTSVWDGRLDSLTSAQIDKLLEQLAQVEFPGDPQALEKAMALVDPPGAMMPMPKTRHER